MITAATIYIFTPKFRLIQKSSIRGMTGIILIKTNPSIFSISFKNELPLLLQTFRRTELVIYLLTQRENMKLKTNVVRANGLNLKAKGNKNQKVFFDKSNSKQR